MSLLAPAALALGLLAIPIILLYMLRLRRREQPISSTFLWRELVRDQAANAPWQRLRRNLLLLLQLLILAALILALARPVLRVPGFGGGSVIVLLDASASMQATDSDAASRFEDARAEAAAEGGAPEALAAAWSRSLALAASKGHAVVIGHPSASTVDFLAASLPALDGRGVLRVKVSELVD